VPCWCCQDEAVLWYVDRRRVSGFGSQGQWFEQRLERVWRMGADPESTRHVGAGETRTQWAVDERVTAAVVVPVIASEVLRGLPQFLQSYFWINHSILPYPYLFMMSSHHGRHPAWGRQGPVWVSHRIWLQIYVDVLLNPFF
jgi:hypothetical protein